MATLDSSPSSFMYEPWSSWLDANKDDYGQDADSSTGGKSLGEESNTMKLSKEDMVLYGVCPAQDEFYMAVCEKCGQVVKPQSLARHIEQRHGTKAAASPSKMIGDSPLKQDSKTPHKGHKPSPSSKADKSHRSRSAARVHGKDSPDKLKKPVVKIERLDDTPVVEDETPSNHCSNSLFQRPKLSYKKTYKEPNNDTGGANHFEQKNEILLSKQDTVPIFTLKHDPDSDVFKFSGGKEESVDKSPVSKKLTSSPSRSGSKNSSAPTVAAKISMSRSKQDPVFLTADLPDLPRSGAKVDGLATFPSGNTEHAKNNFISYDLKTIPDIPTADLPDPPRARSEHLQSGNLTNLVVENFTDIAIKQEDEPSVDYVRDIPETSVARDNEELLAEFEKMEETIEKQRKKQSTEDIDTNIKVKLESELQKIKREEKTIFFEIDNRSTTPVLHIPDSPKSDSGESNSLGLNIGIPQSPVLQKHTNSAIYFPDSATTDTNKSRPPSRAYSHTSSRPPSRQSSCSQAQVKSEPITWTTSVPTSVVKPLSLSISSPPAQASVSHLLTSAIKQEPSLFGTKPVGAHIAQSETAVSQKGHQAGIDNSYLSPTKKLPKEHKDQKFIPCKDRVYDPEKHCGVWIAEQDRHCTRSLTCKTHSLTLRRNVQGRSKSFDEILTEHKATKEAQLKAKCEARGEPYPPPSTKTPPSSATKTPPQTSKTHSTLSRQGSSNSLLSTPKSVAVARTMTVTSSSPVTSFARLYHKMSPQAVAATVMSTSSVVTSPVVTASKKLLLSPSAKPAVLATAKSEEPLGSNDLTSDEESDVPSDGSSLAHHPTPIAVNGWGARRYGSGCFAFSQKADRLRNAFQCCLMAQASSQGVSPAKKLCLDLKSPESRRSSVSDSSDSFLKSPPASANHTNLLLHRQKSRSSPAIGGANRTIKPSPVCINLLSPPQSQVTGSASAVKRKRPSLPASSVGTFASSATFVSTAMVVTTANTTFSSPISITIPPGLSLASLGSTLNATLVATPQQSHATGGAPQNSFSIVVSSPDKLGSLVNGQLLNLQSINLADVTQLQLHNSASGGSKYSSKNHVLNSKVAYGTEANSTSVGGTATGSTKPQTKAVVQPVHIDLSGGGGSLMASLAPGTFIVDSAHSEAKPLLTASGSAQKSSSSTVHMTESGGKGPGLKLGQHTIENVGVPRGVLYKKENTPNGALSQGTVGVQLAALPTISINPRPTLVNELQPNQKQPAALKIHGRNNNSIANTVHLSKHATLHTGNVHTQLSAAPQLTLNLTQAGSGARLMAPGVQHVYTANQLLAAGHVTPVQLQGSAASKGGATTVANSGGKMHKQPVSLTIMGPALSTGQTRPLLLSGDSVTRQPEMMDLTASPPSVT